MTTTQSPAAPTRTYADYSAPLWRRWLLTREMAVIALTVAVFVYAIAQRAQLRRPADREVPAPGHRTRSC